MSDCEQHRLRFIATAVSAERIVTTVRCQDCGHARRLVMRPQEVYGAGREIEL